MARTVRKPSSSMVGYSAGFRRTIPTPELLRTCSTRPRSSSSSWLSASSPRMSSADGGARRSGSADGTTTRMTASDRWLTGLEQRHFSRLTFQEVSRALRALSATYVERRDRLREGAALSGAGKRAAFAVFYGPLHYLLVREIVQAIGGQERAVPRRGGPALSGPATLIDLGCGTGAAGAAWAEACDPHPQVVGVDTHPWRWPKRRTPIATSVFRHARFAAMRHRSYGRGHAP